MHTHAEFFVRNSEKMSKYFSLKIQTAFLWESCRLFSQKLSTVCDYPLISQRHMYHSQAPRGYFTYFSIRASLGEESSWREDEAGDSWAPIILFREEDAWTSIILFRTASFASSRSPAFKEPEIRLPPGLLSANGLPTYFQLTSNQQTLFRGTNNRIKRFGTRRGRGRRRWGVIEYRVMPAISIKSKSLHDAFLLAGMKRIFTKP